MRNVLLLLLGFVLVISMTGYATAKQSATEIKTIKITHYGGPGHYGTIFIKKWLAKVEERSDGKLQTDLYLGGSLVSLEEAFDAIRKGVVQVGTFTPNYEPKKFGAVAGMTQLPFHYSMPKFAKEYRDCGFYDWVESYNNKYNLHLLSWMNMGDFLLASKEPIRKMEDMKGKVISCPGALQGAVKLWGGTVSTVPFGEYYQALQRGVLDGCFVSISTVHSSHLWEVAKYLLSPDTCYSNVHWVMNLDFYKGLSSRLKMVIDNSTVDTEKEYYGVVSTNAEKYTQEAKEKGMKYYKLPADERTRLIEAVEPLYEQMAKKFGKEWDRYIDFRKSIF